MPQRECIFCKSPPKDMFLGGQLGFISWDSHPVNKGHALIVPYRHFSSFFDATDDEKAELLLLLDQAKQIIDREHAPDGYNVGINVGAAAGQSIPHLHIHLIPRYSGDMENPQGGVRGVIPGRQKY